MSSNKKEFNVIDVSKSIDKANEPSSNTQSNVNVLDNMNYKDILRISEDEYLETFSAQNVINTSANVVATLFGFLGFPYVGVIPMYQKLLDFLWPNDNTSVWENMMAAVEELIDQKINKAVKSEAIGKLKGLGANMNEYQSALEDWLEDPTGRAMVDLVKHQFEIINQLFIHDMETFSAEENEVLLLDVYAQAANMHLILLRDAEIYGAQWGMSQNEINHYYKSQEKSREKYSDYCVRWYHKGLDELRKSNAKDWIIYNRFRREMTINVLDFVALFPSYDARKYPKPTNAELTRIVYTDPIGYDERDSGGNNHGSLRAWYEYGLSFSDIENTVNPSPTIVRWLNNIKIYSSSLSITPYSATYWAGHSMELTFTADDSNNEIVSYGDTSKSSYYQLHFPDIDIYRTESLVGTFTSIKAAHLALSRVFFHGVLTDEELPRYRFEYKKSINFPFLQEKNSETEIAVQNDNPDYGNCLDYSHRLCYISNAPIKRKIGTELNKGFIPVFGWIHTGVSRDNRIDPEIITQIPAVKAWNIYPPSKVISSNGYCGGNIVHFTTPNAYRSEILDLKLTISSPDTPFTIRIRYASDIEGTLGLVDEQENYIVFNIQKTMNLGESFSYSSFQYVETETISSLSDSYTLIAHLMPIFRNIYIDKIEFINVTETEI